MELTPLVLVLGPEELLVERAVSAATAAARAGHPATEIVELEGGGYEAGALAVHASPSLFAEPRLVVLHGLEDAGEALVTDVLAYLDEPADDVTLVLCHRGGHGARRCWTPPGPPAPRSSSARPSRATVTRATSSPGSSGPPAGR